MTFISLKELKHQICMQWVGMEMNT